MGSTGPKCAIQMETHFWSLICTPCLAARQTALGDQHSPALSFWSSLALVARSGFAINRSVLVGVRHAPHWFGNAPSPRHVACYVHISGKGQRGPPLCCATLPVAPFLPPFPAFCTNARAVGHGCPGGGRQPPSLFVCCRPPPSIHQGDAFGVRMGWVDGRSYRG